MTDTLLSSIQRHLDNAAQPTSLRDLFAQTLNWGRPQGSGQQLRVGGGVSSLLIAQPVAQLGAIPVFRIDWPAPKGPNVLQRRAVYQALSPVAVEHLICYVSEGGRQVAFVWARNRGGKRVEMRTLPYEQGSSARTTIERLAALAFHFDEFDHFGAVAPTRVLERLNMAFDVEAVTKQFFATYRHCFEQAEALISGIDDLNAGRLFVQKLFNRLMFVLFLERKGWLRYGDRRDYLRALWEAHLRERIDDPTANFYVSRLKLLFFAGLNTPNAINVVAIRRNHVLEERIGSVPYLNGGLFEEDDDDRNDAILVPDAALEELLTDLFYRFNFTVSESTPFDIEVAVDPEMLGKVFEELVTGRHESGSYYTPRPIVAFMCREGLKGYLQSQLPHETASAITSFVDDRDADELLDPEQLLAALKRVRSCDPACGSGAYLLGMLQELLALRVGLFAARRVDPVTTYQRKLEIIQHSIYGVDLDPFAVNIARLRLWLSLVVDYEGDTPPPLPNLDYKVEVGNSLTAPDPSGGLQPDMFRQQKIDELFELKERYLRAHGGEKLSLRAQVEAKEQEIATSIQRKEGVDGFDWAVKFAEVFAAGGFDIVVANPPYVRQELITAIKPLLEKVFPRVYHGSADLYCYFYSRAVQLLKNEGMMAFISPNKWFRANYGKNLRKYMFECCEIFSITDFGDLPVFETATTYPVIFISKKKLSEKLKTTIFTEVKSLQPPYPDVLQIIKDEGKILSSEAISSTEWILNSFSFNVIRKIKITGIPLEKYVQKHIYRGVTTGYNDAFVINEEIRNILISQDPSSRMIIKPWIRGRDVKRWEITQTNLYLIFTRRGIDINQYPAIHDYLSQFKSRLTPGIPTGRKPGRYAWYEIQDSTDYYQELEKPKIIWPDIAKRCEFVLDLTKSYPDATLFTISLDDLYLLGVLNSSSTGSFITSISSSIQNGYLRFKRVYLAEMSIPNAPADERAALATLAQQCLAARGQGPQVAAWEAEIDERVARLYGLSSADLNAIRGEGR